MRRWSWLILFAPIFVYALGMALNQVASWGNGGYMPVLAPEGCTHRIPDWNHGCMTAHSTFKWLGDWIIGNDGLSSIGDFLQDASKHLELPTILAYLGLTVRSLVKGK